MEHQSASFWHTETPTQPVERRVWWQFESGRGELRVFIHPGQPIPNLTDLSEKAAADRTLEQRALRPEQPIAPGFVFASAGKSSSTGETIVTAPGHREIPVVESPGVDPTAEAGESQTMRARMERTGDATPPAQVAAGDHAVGLLVRKDVLYFYPLAAVTTEAEIESYREGTASTDDLVRELPFQS